MTREEILKLSASEIEARKAELAKEAESATVERLAEIGVELDAIEERSKALSIKARAAKAVAGGAGQPIGSPVPKAEKRTLKEVRDSQEYIEAFANYIRTNKDIECRALLTENVTELGDNSGPVPVPTFIEERIRQAWERDEIWSRIRKIYVPGNVKVGFEISATDAGIHNEGADALPEEKLVLGIVELVPQTIKKWITVSDEVLALGAYDMLAYLYDEITYKIIQYASKLVVQSIATAPETSTSAAVGVPIYEPEGYTPEGASEQLYKVSIEDVLLAKAQLSGDVTNLVAICSRQTEAELRIQALKLGYPIDPFDGMTVIHHNFSLPIVKMIIGDLSGVLANLPEGDAVRFVFDEYSLAEKDLVKIVGRMMAAIAVTDPGKFVNIEKGLG